jgi:hypothetical protein
VAEAELGILSILGSIGVISGASWHGPAWMSYRSSPRWVMPTSRRRQRYLHARQASEQVARFARAFDG